LGGGIYLVRASLGKIYKYYKYDRALACRKRDNATDLTPYGVSRSACTTLLTG